MSAIPEEGDWVLILGGKYKNEICFVDTDIDQRNYIGVIEKSGYFAYKHIDLVRKVTKEDNPELFV